MSIQILGLRPQPTNPKKKMHVFFEKNWQAPSVADILYNPEEILKDIPEEHRWNLYFTVHDCDGKSERDFTKQWYVPIDVDSVPEDERTQVVKTVCEAIKADYNKTGSLCSGNGVQLFVPLDQPITDMGYFEETRKVYKILATQITLALKAKGLHGSVDTSVWSPRRLMRMPETLNKKEDRPTVRSFVIQKHSEPFGWSLDSAVTIPGFKQGSSISLDELKKRYPKPDTQGVLEGCLFLNHVKENPGQISEPEWYAALSVLVHLDGGMGLCHDYSEGHHGYSHDETQLKAEQAANFGPRTCEDIDAKWRGCHNCVYYKQCVSPIALKRPEYIETEGTGFWKETVTAKGQVKYTPAFGDLAKYWKKKTGRTFRTGKGLQYVYDKDEHVWRFLESEELYNFIFMAMDPSPQTSIVREAGERILLNEFKHQSFFERPDGLINMRNGVYDIANDELKVHSPDYGFRNRVSFDYDPRAKAPRFEQFLKEITCNDQSIANVLTEFMGYALSGDSYWLHKALFLIGEGENGKSTFNDVLKELIGGENTSSLSLAQLKEPQHLYLLDGKLANLGDENKPLALLDAENFKSAVSGGSLLAKKVYAQPYEFKNRAKFIFNCNTMPTSNDKTQGLYRRAVMIPFNATFKQGDKNFDPHILDKLLAELPGIFNIVMKGYRRLRTSGRLTDSSIIKDLTEVFKETQNDISDWFLDRISKDGDFLSIGDLHKDYMDYCERERIKYPENKLSFSQKVSKYFKEAGIDAYRKKIGQRQHRGYRCKFNTEGEMF